MRVQVGSWLYMAPEMVTSHQYTEKVDVFSIGVMLFEALRGRLNVTKLAITHDPGSLQDYAESVADGFREDIPSNWPDEVSSLIRDSWHQVRPPPCCTGVCFVTVSRPPCAVCWHVEAWLHASMMSDVC